MVSLLATTSSGSGGSSMMIIWIVILFVFIWLFMFRPQSKAQKQKNAMLANMAVGDTVLTTSGFYGTIIDIADDTVIVEFGNNKNCRIPMTKNAIQEIEKPESAVAAPEDAKEEQKEEKKEKRWKK